MSRLVIDIGGTYIRFSRAKENCSFSVVPHKIKAEPFASFEEAARNYLRQQQIDPAALTHVAIAKSGRSNWSLDQESCAPIFPNAHITLVNDFEANAYGLIDVSEDDLLFLGGEQRPPDKQQMRAVIGSGTGLGLAYISPQGEVLKTHGGHMRPALETQAQMDMMAAVQKFKTSPTIPIYEDVLGGDGLLSMYKILAAQGHLYTDYRDTHHMLEAGQRDPVVRQVMTLYHEILGLFAHQVLAFGHSYGALYLTGGITDRLIGHNLFAAEIFLKSLYQKTVPIVLDDVRDTPVYWVKDEFVSLKGLLRMAQ